MIAYKLSYVNKTKYLNTWKKHLKGNRFMIRFISVILCNNKSQVMNLSRKSKVLSLSVPPEIVEELNELAKTEDKSRSEIFKEMFKTYKESLAEREWRELFSFGKETAKRFKIKDEEELFKILNEERF